MASLMDFSSKAQANSSVTTSHRPSVAKIKTCTETSSQPVVLRRSHVLPVGLVQNMHRCVTQRHSVQEATPTPRSVIAARGCEVLLFGPPKNDRSPCAGLAVGDLHTWPCDEDGGCEEGRS